MIHIFLVFKSFLNEKHAIYLNEKFKNLRDLRQQMTAENPNDRPDCDGILERKRHWGLESTHLNDNPFVKNFAQKCLEVESLENSFITRFIMIKFKNLMKDFEIPEINFKKLIEPKILVEPKMNETTGHCCIG
jgi:hypothetical protein